MIPMVDVPLRLSLRDCWSSTGAFVSSATHAIRAVRRLAGLEGFGKNFGREYNSSV
jgi:hypothetical protein